MRTEKIRLGVASRDVTEKVDFDKAEKILLSKGASFVWEAETDGDGIILRERFDKCPDCGKVFPAYRWRVEEKEYHCLRTECEIREFCDPQLSLLAKKKKLPFNTLLSGGRKVFCPFCGSALSGKNDGEEITLTAGEGKIVVARKLSLPELMEFPCAEPLTLCGTGDCTEAVTFDLCRGETTLSVREGENTLFFTEVAENGIILKDRLCRIIGEERQITGRIAECFAEYFPEGLPFEKEEMNLRRFRRMTMFTGFGRDFYEGIPFDRDTGLPAAEFAPFFREVRRMEEIPGYLAQRSVPGAKKLRRLIFDRQSFLFYAEEIRWLWDLMGSADRTTRLLEQVGSFLAAYLKMYPSVKEFLRDYTEDCGSARLQHLLEKNLFRVCHYALFYALTGGERRARERASFSTDMENSFCRFETRYMGGISSVPILWETSYKREEEMAYRTEGYLFRRICSSSEYRCAGAELSNCLAGYGAESFVVGITRNGVYEGAIELDKTKVGLVACQIKGKLNKAIGEDSRLGKAIGNFMNHYGIAMIVDDEDGELFP